MLENMMRDQNVIPSTLQERTDCGLLWSREVCQFGKNWNRFKEDLIHDRNTPGLNHLSE